MPKMYIGCITYLAAFTFLDSCISNYYISYIFSFLGILSMNLTGYLSPPKFSCAIQLPIEKIEKKMPEIKAKFKMEAATMPIGRERNNGKGTFGGE